jgi:hypothetical protein
LSRKKDPVDAFTGWSLAGGHWQLAGGDPRLCSKMASACEPDRPIEKK